MKKYFLILMFIMLIGLASATLNAHGVAFSGSSSSSNKNGVEILMNHSVIISQIIKDGGSAATTCYLYNSGKTQVATGSFVANNCSIEYNVTKDLTYYAMVDKGGASYTRTDTGGLSLPYTQPDLNFTASCYEWNGAKLCDGSEIYDVEAIITEEIPPINPALILPTNGSAVINNPKLVANATPISYDLANATFQVWDSSGTIVNTTTNTTFNSVNSSTITITGLGIGMYEWNANICGTNATGYECEWADANFTLGIGFNVTNNLSNTTTAESSSESYILNITTDSIIPTSASLYYNGTAYSATITALDSDNYTLSRTIDVPLGVGNVSFYYSFSVSGIKLNTTTYNQEVTRMEFALCNATYTDDFLNITFADEETLDTFNATIPGSTWVYYLGSGTVNKTLSYTSTDAKFNYTFCAVPTTGSLNVIPFVQYKNGTTYPQRIWNPLVQIFTSTVTEKVLYLLSILNGQYVTFQVINSADQVISDVDVTAIRDIDGTDTIVGTGTTGADGSVTFWLNPDFSHDYSFSKTGFDTFETSFAPTQTSYTITLGGGEVDEVSLIKGIDYTITPPNVSLVNDTTYNFGLILTSSFWDLDTYGFTLRLANGSQFTGGSTAVSGTQLTLAYDTTNQTVIYLDYWWVIDGNSTNATVTWIVFNTENTGWSIKTLFIDLNAYLSEGFFGIDDFGRYLIIFIILFTTVGIISFKYGFTSPIGVMTIVFGVIYFFDVVVDLIPSLLGINNMLTYIAALVLVLFIAREVSR